MEQEESKQFESVLNSKEQFVGEVEWTFWSLKDRKPFSLGVDMGHFSSMEVDVHWNITPPGDRHRWSLSEVEFMLSVLASRQTPNVKETKLSLSDNSLDDVSAEVWKLMSKLNNLTYLNLEWNKLRAVSPLLGDLIHLQQLKLGWNKLSAEGVVGVCELLKVCCSIADLLVDCGRYSVG